MSVFSTQLCDLLSPLLPLSPSLWFNSRPIHSFPTWCILYIRIQCVRGVGYGVLLETIFYRSFTLCIWPDSEPTKFLDQFKQKPGRGVCLRRINNCRKVPLQIFFFRRRHFALPSMSLSFYCCYPLGRRLHSGTHRPGTKIHEIGNPTMYQGHIEVFSIIPK